MTTSGAKKLEAVLKHFSLQELCDLAIHKFPETTWDKIQNYIITRSQAISKKNAIQSLLNIVEKTIDKDELENRASELLLIVIGKSTKRTWTAVELKEKNNDVSSDKILNNVISTIRRTGILANIHCTKFNSKIILSVEKKVIRKQRGIRKQCPLFFQFIAKEPYLFCSRKSVNEKLLQAITEALGYKKFKICNFFGPNVIDLLKILKNKKSGVNIASSLFSEPQLLSSVKSTENTTEFGQRENRKEYAEKLFGENPPQLQSISVTLKDAVWQQVGDFDKMNGVSLDGVKMTLSAPNVAEFIKELIESDLVVSPTPQYMKAILNSGRNEFKITQNIS